MSETGHATVRMKEIFENTIENGITYDGDMENVDYYSLFCKAASQEKLYKLLGNNICMFNCIHEKCDSIMIIFFIPINSDETGAKNVAERVMEVVEAVETCFVTLDALKSEEVKEDKFIYVTAIKKLKGD
jgi:hypothetical protein